MRRRTLKIVSDEVSLPESKISYLEPELSGELPGSLEGTPPVFLGELNQNMKVSEILDLAGGEFKAVVSVSEIIKLVENQETAKGDLVLSIDQVNLFFIKKEGVLYLVGVIWKKSGWNISRYSHGISLNFSSGTRLFVGKK